MTQPDLFSQPVAHPFAPKSHASWKAAQQVHEGYRQTITAAYLRMLKDVGPSSDEDAYLYLKHEGLRLARSSMSSIRAACMASGLVCKSEAMGKSLMGRDVHLWQLTEAGRAAVETLR